MPVNLRQQMARQMRRQTWTLGVIGYVLVSVAIVMTVAVTFSRVTLVPGVTVRGPGVVSGTQNIRINATGPSPVTTPEELVADFLWANSFRNRPDAIRRYLDPASAANWRPATQVLIFDAAKPPKYKATADGKVSVTVTPIGTLDKLGTFTPGESAQATTITVGTVKQGAHSWRVQQYPVANSALISWQTFLATHVRRDLVYVAQNSEALIPVSRWLPNDVTMDGVISQLVEGPGPNSPNLTTALSGAMLSRPVDLADDEVRIDLVLPVNPSLPETQLIQRQVVATIAPLAQGRTLALSLNGNLKYMKTVEEKVPIVHGLNPHASLMASTGSGKLIQLLDNGRTQKPIIISNLKDMPVTSYATGIGGLAVAAISESGTQLLGWNGFAGDVTFTHDSSKPLVKPSIDDFGWYWAISRGKKSTFTAVRSDSVTRNVDVSTLAALDVSAAEVSPDGMNVFMLAKDGTSSTLWVAPMMRALDGTPTSVGTPRRIARSIDAITNVSWAGASTLAVVGSPTSAIPDISGQVHAGALNGVSAKGKFVVVPLEAPPYVIPGITDLVSVALNQATGEAFATNATGDSYFYTGQRWDRLAASFVSPTFSF